MKTVIYAACILFAYTASSQAQVSIQARVSHNLLAEGEPVAMTLEIMNQTAAPLDLTSMCNEGSFTIHVQSQSGRHYEMKHAPIFSRSHVLQPWMSTSVVVNLQRHFDIHYTDAYSVYARITADGRSYASDRVLFDVVPGAKMGKIQVGVALDGGRYRTYRLLSIQRKRSEYLFLHIMNEDEGVHYGTHELGRIIKLFKPVLRADREGNVHVLHQSGPTQYTHASFTPFGAPLNISLYAAEISKIRLEAVEGGKLVVRGGKPISQDTKSLRRDTYDSTVTVPEF